jgi:hypothetical protein
MQLVTKSSVLLLIVSTVSSYLVSFYCAASGIGAERPTTAMSDSTSEQMPAEIDFGPNQKSTANPEVTAPQRSRSLQGRASTYEAFGALSDEVQFRMGFKSVTDDSEDVVITEVSPNTAAYECGLKIGDRIIDAQLNDNALDVTIQRGGKTYMARLRARRIANPVFFAQKGQMDNTQRKPFTLNAEQTVINDNELIPEKATADKTPKPIGIDARRFALEADKDAKLLAQYNLELIVDRSRSMQKPDCPGGLSRWAWCGQQAGQLSRSLAPYTPNGLTIIPFATEFDVFEHATPQNIERMFNNIELQNGTRLFEPLAERLDDYFVHHKRNSKPLLIVVITDGVPSPKFEPALVRNELIAASQKMSSPQEVSVIFCQIGCQDRFGQRYLTDLDQNLVDYGARYRFVHVITFDALQESGLGPALVASIKQYAPMPPQVVSVTDAKAKRSGDATRNHSGNIHAQKNALPHLSTQ